LRLASRADSLGSGEIVRSEGISHHFWAISPAVFGMCTVLLSIPAHAQTKGEASLELARDAWNRGELGQAESLLNEALSRGGLKRDQTLECYVRLGAARAVLGKKDAAQTAFRFAALMNSSFVVPPDAGKRAVQVADAVRKQQIGFGELALKLELPQKPKVATSIPVTVTMDGAHTTLFARVGLAAKESTTGKTFAFEMTPAETMHFTVPATLALPNGEVSIHIEALDTNDNQLAVTEGHARIASEIAKTEKVEEKKRGGFWSSPWPYVIGSVVLAGAAAGGIGIYFGAQSSSQINVGAPSVRPGS
jgi:hypothetical protein